MPSPNFSRRIPELDGIRGTAILTILIYHWLILEGAAILPERLETVGSFGWSGVDLFFVLSGFLIGGILLDARRATNYFKVFYVRRLYRILPLYGALCLLSIAVFYAHLSTHAWLFEEKIPWYAYCTFGQNFWMAKYNAMSSRQLDATWSLAVEEQFYLTLPLLIRFVKERYLPYVLLAGIVLAPILRCALWLALDPIQQFTATYVLAPCRMDALLLGVLAAWALRREAGWQWFVAHRLLLSAAALGLGIGYVLMIHKRWGLGSFAQASFGFTWIALFDLSLLLLAVTHKPGFVSRIFRLRLLTELGILAYGLYLFHQPMLGLLYGLWGKKSPKLVGTAQMGVTSLAAMFLIVFARLSWNYFEKPLVKIGHRHQYLEAGAERPPEGH